MDTVTTNKSFMQPKPMSELLPELGGILSLKGSMQTLTAKKQPRSTLALTRTSEKNMKPLTIAEMRAEILALKAPSPRRFAQPTTSAKKKTWNSSVKVENKTRSRTSQGQLKNNPVRKGLNFQAKPMVGITISSETPKFPKPELRPKKTFHLQAKSSVRISGVCNIPETPITSSIPIKSRMTLVNKENLAHQANVNPKPLVNSVLRKKNTVPPVPVTPLANMSWKSGSDTSFLQREREVHDMEKAKALTEEQTLENIVEVSPPVSTPFKEYRNVQEFFNHSDDTDNSALYHDNTIMCFDNIPQCKQSSQREENVIVTLCDLLKNKASIVNSKEPKSDIDDLLEVEKQLLNNINMIENGIKMLTNIRETELKSLHYVQKVIKEKNTQNTVQNNIGSTSMNIESEPKVEGNRLNEISPVTSKSSSVIRTKSLSYKVPKKSSCLRKKILYKSMPNVADGMRTPNKDMDNRAFNMYMEMKMKQQMNFLNTPRVKHERLIVPDTPAVTSHNLQMQLDKIYKDNT